MPQYTLDLSGYKPSLSDTVPDGRYLAVVEDYDLGKAKSSGNDMFTIWLRIVEGPQSGNVIIDRLTTTGKGLFKIVGFLNGLGAPTPKKRLSINPESWKNRKVYIDTSKSEPYKGRPGTSQVDGYSRWVADEATAAAEADAYEAVEAEPVKAFETVPAVESTVSAVLDGEVLETEDGPVEVPVKNEPEMLNLSDLAL